jgi:hypothetical protein
MRNMNIILGLILSIVCSASSCKKSSLVERVYSIKVQNNSSNVINYLVSYNYLNTLIPDDQANLRGLKANDYGSYDNKEDWDVVLGKTKGGKIIFFFFSSDTIAKYGWSKVRGNDKNSQYSVVYP